MGVESCPGTCTHVWQYAQTMARIFPEAELNVREETDLVSGIGFDDSRGVFYMRAENEKHVAQDGHCGTVMRIDRELKLSEDDTFFEKALPED